MEWGGKKPRFGERMEVIPHVAVDTLHEKRVEHPRGNNLQLKHTKYTQRTLFNLCFLHHGGNVTRVQWLTAA